MSRDRQNSIPFSGSVSKGKILRRFFLELRFSSEHRVAYNNNNNNNNIVVGQGHRYGLCDWTSAPPISRIHSIV